MFKSAKNIALAAALAAAPLSASALSFYGDVAPGDTYNFTDGQQSLVAVAVNDEAAGSFSFDVTNNTASTWTFLFGIPFLNNNLTNGSFSFGPDITNETGSFTQAVAAGDTVTLTVFYDDLFGGDNNLGAVFSAVPLPAGLVLLLSALGIAGVMRSSRRGASLA